METSIDIDIPGRRLALEVPETELSRRRAAWRRPAPRATKGVLGRYVRLVQGADKGAVLGDEPRA